MNIVIVDGRQEANYIIKQFNHKKNSIKVINQDIDFGKSISRSNGIPVYQGDATKKFIFETANIYDYDLLIALSDDDIRNYVICSIAKKQFNLKKTLCVVNNPQKVDLYKHLGIDDVISSTYLLGESVQNQVSIETAVKKLTIKANQIVLFEIHVDKNYYIANKKIKDINFPIFGNISCITRANEVIIVNGETEIKVGDTLYIMSKPENQNDIINFIRKKNN